MEKIEPGKYVELIYDLYERTADGDKLVHCVDAGSPDRIIYGVTPGVVAPLEKAIAGLKKGERFDVSVSAADAFGPHDPEQVAHLDRSIFEIDGRFDDRNVFVGNYLLMNTADGHSISGKVVEITATQVVMDFNHPMAGKDVHFVGRIGAVRPATEQELHRGRCGGCTGGGCGGGDCSDSSCQSGGCCGGC